MTETLFDLTHEVAAELGVVVEGYATGGSITTIVDANERTETDDHFNGGSAWILRDSAGAGAAPENEMEIISDFANSTNTITLQSALSEAVAAGDWYALATKLYPLYQIIRQINRALTTIGPVPVTSKTLTTVAGQTLYDLPAVAMNLQINDVRVATSSDSDDPDYVTVYDWDIERTAVGSVDKLYLPDRFGTGFTVAIDYIDYHIGLRVETDQLNERIPKQYLIYQACLNLLLWRKKQPGGSGDRTINESVNFYNAKLNEMKAMFEDREHQAPRSKLFPVRSTRVGRRYPGDRNPR